MRRVNYRIVGQEKRYPIEPLLRLVALRLELTSLVAVAEAGGTTHRTLMRAKNEEGGLTWSLADQLSIALLNLHPALVWPDWTEDGFSVLDALYHDEADRVAWLYREEGMN